jgi:hypothetical protein
MALNHNQGFLPDFSKFLIYFLQDFRAEKY